MKKFTTAITLLVVLFPTIVYSISSRVIGDIDYDEQVGVVESIYSLQVSAGIIPQSVPEYDAMYSLVGSYIYSSPTITVNITGSNFPKNIGPTVGVNTYEVGSITATEMTWIINHSIQITWYRKSGQPGEITGSWEYDEIQSSQTYRLLLNSDNSASIIMYTMGYNPSYIVPERTITIDGNISDWSGIVPIVADPSGDETPSVDFVGTDLNGVYVAYDDTYLYLLITLHDGPPKTDYHTQYGVQFDLSPNETDTPGDHLTKAGFSGGNWYSGIHIRCFSISQDSASYPSNYVGAGSNFIEWKVELSDMMEGNLDDLNGTYMWAYTHTYQNNPPENPISDDSVKNIRLIFNN